MAASAPPCTRRADWPTILGFTVVALSLLSGSYFAGRYVHSSGSRETLANSAQTGLLRASESLIDLGTVPQRGQAERTIILTNDSGETVEVSRIKSSCPCLKGELSPRVLEPGQRGRLTLRLDMNEEPEFTGGLGMNVRGQTEWGEVAFALTVSVNVRPGSK